tara:strand:- start:929 stop:1216 length:288 start_codon:yes stop_codon:yes gene_type:complete
MDYLKNLAEGNDPEHIYRYGLAVFNGHDCVFLPKEGIIYLQKADGLGSVAAHNKLLEICKEGISFANVEEDGDVKFIDIEPQNSIEELMLEISKY